MERAKLGPSAVLVSYAEECPDSSRAVQLDAHEFVEESRDVLELAKRSRFSIKAGG